VCYPLDTTATASDEAFLERITDMATTNVTVTPDTGETAPPFCGRTTRNFQQDHAGGGACQPNASGYCNCPLELAPPKEAELVCSDNADGMHLPVIDIDLPVQLVPSATPGHFHLYIDHPISWQHYKAILRAMAEAGIVQWGYYDATLERGYGSLRHPDRLKKEEDPV
jgi:hypothetical protein